MKSGNIESDSQGTVPVTGERSRQGYRLNKFASSLTVPKNRTDFLADEDAYMRRFNLDERQRSLVRTRNWQGLIDAGGNIYVMLKLAATVGSNLLAMGAEMRGETVEAFLATRTGSMATEAET